MNHVLDLAVPEITQGQERAVAVGYIICGLIVAAMAIFGLRRSAKKGGSIFALIVAVLFFGYGSYVLVANPGTVFVSVKIFIIPLLAIGYAIANLIRSRRSSAPSQFGGVNAAPGQFGGAAPGYGAQPGQPTFAQPPYGAQPGGPAQPGYPAPPGAYGQPAQPGGYPPAAPGGYGRGPVPQPGTGSARGYQQPEAPRQPPPPPPTNTDQPLWPQQ